MKRFNQVSCITSRQTLDFKFRRINESVASSHKNIELLGENRIFKVPCEFIGDCAQGQASTQLQDYRDLPQGVFEGDSSHQCRGIEKVFLEGRFSLPQQGLYIDGAVVRF